jgi:hypothetical protein
MAMTNTRSKTTTNPGLSSPQKVEEKEEGEWLILLIYPLTI